MVLKISNVKPRALRPCKRVYSARAPPPIQPPSSPHCAKMLNSCEISQFIQFGKINVQTHIISQFAEILQLNIAMLVLPNANCLCVERF